MSVQDLLQELNFDPLDGRHRVHFKRSGYRKPQRRIKTLKQILQQELVARKTAMAKAVDATDTVVPTQSVVLSWNEIEAPPSVLPQKKYCDITGLEAKYQDPKTRLRYNNREIFHVVRGLMGGLDQQVGI
jgi:hypothetical protein